MRGKTTACDNCRNKKVKCEGKFPCKYCCNRGLDCTNHYIPKKTSRYNRKSSNGVVGVRQSQKRIGSVEDRLARIETLLQSFINKVDDRDVSLPPYTPITDTEDMQLLRQHNKILKGTSPIYSNSSTGLPEDSNISIESLDPSLDPSITSYTSTFTVKGLTWIADCVNDYHIQVCLNKLITNFIEIERRLLSNWVDPRDISGLSALPPRNIISLLLDSYNKIMLFEIPFLEESKRLIWSYCDYRDGLIPKPRFSYGELLSLNATLHLSCSAHYEILKIGIVSELDTSPESILRYESVLRDNSLYYYNRLYLTGDGIFAIQGIICLMFIAAISFSMGPLESMSTCAIIQAQNLGLHTAEYYAKLKPKEAQNTLSLWWTVYFMHQLSVLKVGKRPVIDDINITAPPLIHAQQFCDIFGTNGLRASLRRAELHNQISFYYEHFLTQSGSSPKFFFVMCLDLTTILSKIQSELFCESPKTDEQYVISVENALADLENWKLCLPKSVAPGTKLFKGFKFNEKSIYDVIRRVFGVSELNVNYSYIKLIVCLFAVRHSEGETREKYIRLGLNTARDSLNFVISMARRALPAAGFALFSSFSAFLNVAAYCIQDPTNPNVEEDVKLLITSCEDYFTCFTESANFTERWIMIGAVCKCILFVAVRVVMDNNNHLYFNLDSALNEVSEIQKAIDSILKPGTRMIASSAQVSHQPRPSRVDSNVSFIVSPSSSISTVLTEYHSETATSYSDSPQSTTEPTFNNSKRASSTERGELFEIHDKDQILDITAHCFQDNSVVSTNDRFMGTENGDLIADSIFKDIFDFNSILDIDQGHSIKH